MTHDVFISYATKDKATADAVCHGLEAEGIRCWIAPRDIRAGLDYAEAIVEAISSSRAVVLIFSSHSNQSRDVHREVQTAFHKSVPVMPLRIDETELSGTLEYYLTGRHWLDTITPPLQAKVKVLAQHVERLLQTGDGQRNSRRTDARRTEPRPGLGRSSRVWLLAALGGVLVLGAYAAVHFLTPRPVDPGEVRMCQQLLQQNFRMQKESEDYAESDMATHLAAVRLLLGQGTSGRAIYFKEPPEPGIGNYGRLSHYWERLSQCVHDRALSFPKVYSSTAFPDGFWTKTRELRQLFGSNWNGPGSGIPDFMSAFQELCRKYRAERLKEGGAAGQLDCSW